MIFQKSQIGTQLFYVGFHFSNGLTFLPWSIIIFDHGIYLFLT